MDNIFVQTYASVKNTLPSVMKINRQSQTSLSKEVNYTQSNVSKIVNGQSTLTYDAFPDYMRALPNHNEAFAIDVMHQVTGVTVPVLNGNRIKQEVKSVVDRGVRELTEAINALTNADDEFEIPADYVRDKSDPENALKEVIDAELFIKAIELSICNEYGYELRGFMKDREKLWAAKGLVK